MISYPRRGRAAPAGGGPSNTNPLFDTDGSIIKYTLATDATTFATSIYGLGAGNADLMVAATSTNAALITAGYPVLETAVSYKDQTKSANLQKLADAELTMRSNKPYNTAPNLPIITV